MSNFVILLFVVLCVFIINVLGDDDPTPVPYTPLQFTAKIKITTEGYIPDLLYGTYYYDFINQVERIDEMVYGDDNVVLQDYHAMLQFSWDTFGKRCQCTAITNNSPGGSRLTPSHIPLGAVYLGTDYVRTDVNVWQLNDPYSENGYYFTYYLGYYDGILQRINRTNNAGVVQLIDFYNIMAVAPPTSIMTPASFCDPKSCPYVPSFPPPPLGSCPNSTTSSCECLYEREEIFCNLIDYPVDSNLGSRGGKGATIDSVDLFAQEVYNATVATLVNPTQTCLDNLKAYICAEYFPVCSGVNYIPAYIPCGSICPSCSCGSNVFNCSGASSNSGYCTQYGSTKYC